jgi:hypothetical protein
MLKIDVLRQLFSGKKALKFDDMKEALADCSDISIRKYLKDLAAQSSVNNNGRYYIIPSQHQFDKRGLLRLRKVVFHRDNTLLKAIISLVNSSSTGMCPADLNDLLLTETRFQLNKLTKEKKLLREGRGGAGSYIYYSDDEVLATAQQQTRNDLQHKVDQELKAEQSSPELLAEKKNSLDQQEVIDVMHTLLQHPDFSAKGVALSLQRRGRDIGLDLVRDIFEVYHLSGKKS